MPATPNPITIPDKLQAAFAADPKRSWLLAALAVVLLILCFRAMRGGPATAGASLLPSPTVLEVPSPWPAAQIRAVSNNALIDWLLQPKRIAKRNLFAMHFDAFTKDSGSSLPLAESISSEELAKSGASQADQTGEQGTLAKQASKLKLQSTFLGPTPMALVNGQLVREGDTIGPFQVVKIEPRRIAVQQDGITLQISMD